MGALTALLQFLAFKAFCLYLADFGLLLVSRGVGQFGSLKKATAAWFKRLGCSPG
jgi:hypothetical protein